LVCIESKQTICKDVLISSQVLLGIGVNVSVIDPPAEGMSALFSVSGDHINMIDASIQNLTTTRDAVLLVQTNSMSMTDSIFASNQAQQTGGLAAQGLAHMSVGNCSFSDNSGKCNVDVPGTPLADVAVAWTHACINGRRSYALHEIASLCLGMPGHILTPTDVYMQCSLSACRWAYSW